MAKAPGRKSLIKKAGLTIAGVRVTGLSFDDTPIDVTDNDSAAMQQLLSESGFQVLSLSASGVESDHILRDIALDPAISKLLTDLTFTFADSPGTKDVISGNFYMTNYKEDNEFKDAGQFSANFTSSGTWTRS